MAYHALQIVLPRLVRFSDLRFHLEANSRQEAMLPVILTTDIISNSRRQRLEVILRHEKWLRNPLSAYTGVEGLHNASICSFVLLFHHVPSPRFAQTNMGGTERAGAGQARLKHACETLLEILCDLRQLSGTTAVENMVWRHGKPISFRKRNRRSSRNKSSNIRSNNIGQKSRDVVAFDIVNGVSVLQKLQHLQYLYHNTYRTYKYN